MDILNKDDLERVVRKLKRTKKKMVSTNADTKSISKVKRSLRRLLEMMGER